MNPCSEYRKLPTIRMIAGGTKVLYFPVTNEAGTPADISGCTARFTAVSATNRLGQAALDERGEIVSGRTDTFSVLVNGEETKDLSGKFIYQMWIFGADGLPEEPQQGELYIYQNITPNLNSN